MERPGQPPFPARTSEPKVISVYLLSFCVTPANHSGMEVVLARTGRSGKTDEISQPGNPI